MKQNIYSEKSSRLNIKQLFGGTTKDILPLSAGSLLLL